MTTCLLDGYCDRAVVQMDVPERCHRLTVVNTAVQLAIVIETKSNVSLTLLSWRIWTENALLFPPTGAEHKGRRRKNAWLCSIIYTNPSFCFTGDLLKSSKHLPAFVWSNDLTGMPSCPLGTEPKSTLVGITVWQEVGCWDQGFCLYRPSVSYSVQWLFDTYHMEKSICANNGGNNFNMGISHGACRSANLGFRSE